MSKYHFHYYIDCKNFYMELLTLTINLKLMDFFLHVSKLNLRKSVVTNSKISVFELVYSKKIKIRLF